MIQDPWECFLELASTDDDDARNIDARTVAQTVMPDGKWVSTVRLPFGRCTYETIVFANESTSSEVLYIKQYSTFDEAKDGHDVAKDKFSR